MRGVIYQTDNIILSRPPDHTQLPDTNGSFSDNVLGRPQSDLLTESLRPKLLELHPDGKFLVAADLGIFYHDTEPALAGCKSPDWFYIPGVPPLLDGLPRRSYVNWFEVLSPTLVVEYVTDDRSDSEARDRTPRTGKFWLYPRVIGAGYYAIYDVRTPSIELYGQYGHTYREVPANADGRYPIPMMGIELGLWDETYRGVKVPWLRAWDTATGKMLPTPEERLG